MRRSALLVSVLSMVLACGKKDAALDAGTPRGDAATTTAIAATAPTSAPTPAETVDTISHASATSWDAGAPLQVTTTIDGSALRARNRARLGSDTSAVTVLTGGTALELGQRICEATVPRRPKETPVLLKPNMGGFDWFKETGGKEDADDGLRGRITNPEFVRGVIRCLKARGHTRITVAEGWGAKHADWERLVKVSGYAEMTQSEGVPLVAMDDDGVFDVEGTQPGKPLGILGMEKTHVPSLVIPKLLAEHLARGLFISIPKMKAHRYAVFSMGIKGMQGTVMTSDAAPAFHQKWRMHRELDLKKLKGEANRRAYVDSLETFAERIADVLEVEAPDVVLVDGAPGMRGDGFQKMYPMAESVAVGGTNVVRVDRVGAAILGLWNNADLGRELLGHTTSPLLEAAAKRFHVDLETVAVVGNGAALASGPRPYRFVGMPGFDLQGSGASSSPAESPAPELHAKATDAPPTLDGTLEALWKTAAAARFDTDTHGDAGGPATTVQALWTKDALYMAWVLEGAGLNVDTTRPTDVEREGLYKEDCVELFLAPKADQRGHYYEIELGPFGHYFDLDVDKDKKTSDIKWSSGVVLATTRDPAARRAVIEAKIPAAEIVSALRAGARLPLGLFRMEGKAPRKYLAWSPARTDKPNFHLPAAFGTLVLE